MVVFGNIRGLMGGWRTSQPHSADFFLFPLGTSYARMDFRLVDYSINASCCAAREHLSLLVYTVAAVLARAQRAQHVVRTTARYSSTPSRWLKELANQMHLHTLPKRRASFNMLPLGQLPRCATRPKLGPRTL